MTDNVKLSRAFGHRLEWLVIFFIKVREEK